MIIMDHRVKQEEIYSWIDRIPLSRQKKNISRDFSDGVLMAETIKYFYPKLVDLHNYCSACSRASKVSNWTLLNRKVLSKLDIKVAPDTIDRLVDATPGEVEELLEELHDKMDELRLQDEEASKNMSEENINFGKFTLNGDTDGRTQSKCLVSPKALSKLKRELEEKDEAINILTDKVSHLESLLSLKSQRIKDLSAQLIRYQSATSAEGRQN